MAITAQKSVQMTNPTLLPNVQNETNVSTGKFRIKYFDFTQVGAGDIGSTVELVQLPYGRVRILRDMCRVSSSVFGAARTLDVGLKAYTKFDGTAQAAAASALKAAADVSAAATNTLAAAAGADPTLYIESNAGVVVQATVAGGTIPDGATLKGYIVYVTD